MILYLIRHGESAYNVERRIQGQTDIALSELGLRQSQAIAEAIQDVKLDAIYSSPLCRAVQTAQPLADVKGLPLRLDERLMEIHAGIFQGLLWSEIDEQCPAEALRWREQDPDFVIPGGESRRQLMTRAAEVFGEIIAAGHASAAIVAHGGLLGAALKTLLVIPAHLNPFSLYNGSISKVHVGRFHKLLTLNDICHLRSRSLDLQDRTGDL